MKSSRMNYLVLTITLCMGGFRNLAVGAVRSIRLESASIMRFDTGGDVAKTTALTDFINSLDGAAQTWKVHRGSVDALVDESEVESMLLLASELDVDLTEELKYSSLPYEAVEDDEEDDGDEQERTAFVTKALVPDISHTKYHTLAQINTWLSNVNSSCDDLCDLQVLGQTVAGSNDLNILRIGNNVQKCGKQKMFIDCGIHAREWIAPATCLYLIDKFLNGYGEDSSITALLDKYEWYFAPVMNPDGYDYTHTTNRMWRKNRRDNQGRCEGVDLNRNWNANFGGTGSSSSYCSDTYRGPSAFSEKESQIYKDFILSNVTGDASNWKSYLTFHSYGQLILYPLGYTYNSAPDAVELAKAANAFRDGISKYPQSVSYTVEQASDLYPASGCSDDWVYEQTGITFAFTIELRDRSSFSISASQIVPTGEEILAGMKNYMSHLESNNHISDTGTSC